MPHKDPDAAKEYHRKYYADNRERILKKAREYQETHREEIKRYKDNNQDRFRKRAADYRRRNRDQLRTAGRRRYAESQGKLREYALLRQRSRPAGQRAAEYRRRRYGVDESRYAQLWAAQEGCCAGCGSPFGDESPHIDHDHRCCGSRDAKTCGQCIRGLLCGDCNRALGMIRDDAATLRRLADYLDAYPLKPKDQMRLFGEGDTMSALSGPQNSGVSIDFQPAVAGSAVEVAAAIGPALASTAAHQAQTAAFIAEYGAQVLDGHGEVAGPGGSGTVEYD